MLCKRKQDKGPRNRGRGVCFILNDHRKLDETAEPRLEGGEGTGLLLFGRRALKAEGTVPGQGLARPAG